MNLKVIAEGIRGAILIGVAVLLSPLMRPWYSKWGATAAEANRRMPGDELVPDSKTHLTLAVTVHAPAAQIWPWLLQLGCQRAGWYSYDLLDNGGISSAERIIPEYQHLEVGDVVKAMPQGDFGFPVAAKEDYKRLTLGGALDTRTGETADPYDPDLEAYFSGDQTFYLEEIPRDNGPVARFIFRMRLGWNSSFFNTIVYRVFLEPISFVMARRTMLNIKRRAEAALV
jgi:hypothetical protein